MKKQIAAVLAASLALAVFAGCGDSEKEKEKNPNNTTPVISGVNETALGQEGVEFNALTGVTAYDEEDGDITSSITVEADGLTFTNGKATPPVAGTYELIYSVKDSDDATGYAYCTLTVSRALAAPVTVVEYGSEDFADTGATVDNCGWTHAFDGSAAGTAGYKPGAYILDITDSGATQNDVTLTKNVAGFPAGSHSVTVWAKADRTTYVNLTIKNASGEIVEETEATEIGTAITQVKLEFTLDTALEGGKICLCLGKTASSPEAYNIMLVKAEHEQTLGSSDKVNPYTQDFSESADSIKVNWWGGSAGTVTNNDGAAQINITTARNEADSGVWCPHAFIGLGNSTLVNGKQYAYSIDLTATNNQIIEFVLVTGENEDKVAEPYNSEKGFDYNLLLEAGVKKTVTGTFTANKDTTTPFFRFQLGGKDAGQTNTFTIDNVEFYEVGEGGTAQTTKPFTDRFRATGGTSGPWFGDCVEEAIGAFYTENNKLVYRIDKLGGADYHNKIGFNDESIVLPADAYITISLTVKASKNVSCAMHLFRSGGAWDVEDDRPTKSMSDANPARNRFNITTTEQTISITVEKTLIEGGKFELLLQDFQCADGSATIEISALKISYQALSED